MSNFALSRLERLYLQKETTFGQVPNTSGTATVANANACRFIKASLTNGVATIQRPDKTGTRSRLVGVRGRSIASWSAEMSVAPYGVAGTAPDMDPLFQALFGQAGSATSTSVSITAASNASPIVVTSVAHGFANGDVVFIASVLGNTAANGVWLIGNKTNDTFELVGSSGNAAYVSGGTASRVGYKYTLSDSILSLAIWSFRQPSTIDQRVMSGAVCTEANFSLGADVATCSFNGEGVWALGSNQFSVADTTQRAGLTAFPSEPSSPVTNGGMIVGFTGKIAVNGYNLANLRTANVRLSTGNTVIKDNFGSYYGNSPEGDERSVGVSFSLYEDDSAAYANLIQIAHDKTAVTIPLFMGTVSGSIFGLILNGVQLTPPTTEEQRRFILNFPEALAHGSSLTAKDEVVAVFI